MQIDKEWLRERAALEGDLEVGAGGNYTPPFAPGPADHYYAEVIAMLEAANQKMCKVLEEIGGTDESQGELQWWQIMAREAVAQAKNGKSGDT